MDSWQKEIIDHNLAKLVEVTDCSEKLLIKLKSSNVLSEDEAEELSQSGTPRTARSHNLYKILLTRENGFENLLGILKETNQSGAVSILSSGVTKKKLGFCLNDTVEGDYDEKIELGRGSNATVVFKGKFANRDVAVKRVNSTMVTQETIIKEVEHLIECDSHENVVRYFGTKVVQQHVLIVLELCDISLKDWITNKIVEISPTEILRQATVGLQWLHSLRIVHRDLKPENILLVKAVKKVKISDFGLSRKILEERSSVSSFASGTQGWIAPEILHESVVTQTGKLKFTFASDIFALGCVYYYVLTDGKHPFGDHIRRNVNILEEKPLILTLDRSYSCAQNIHFIEFMISNDPLSRPSCSALLLCPLFWPPGRRFNFIDDLTEHGKDVLKVVVTSYKSEKQCWFDHTAEVKKLNNLLPEIAESPCAVPFIYLEYQSMQKYLPAYYLTENDNCKVDSSIPFPKYLRRSQNAVESMLKSIMITDGFETTRRIIGDVEKFITIMDPTEFLMNLVRNCDGDRLPPDFMDTANLMVQRGADPDTTFGGGDKFLHTATGKFHDPQLFQTLLEFLVYIKKTASFGTSDSMNKTVLHHAVKCFEPFDETLEMLALYGNANYNVVDNEGATIFVSAIKGGRSESFLRKLINRGADWKHLDDEGFTALHYAALCVNLPAFKLLISLDANVNAKNIYNSTPLHEAFKGYIQYPHTQEVDEIILTLVSCGADMNIENVWGNSPIEGVCKSITGPDVSKHILELLKQNIITQPTK